MRTLFTAHPSAAARLVYALVMLAAVIGLAAMFVLWNNQRDALSRQVHRTAIVAAQANRALCLSKTDRRRQLQNARRFLTEHPNGTPDFSRAFILMSLHQDEVVLANLRDVRCPPPQLSQ